MIRETYSSVAIQGGICKRQSAILKAVTRRNNDMAVWKAKEYWVKFLQNCALTKSNYLSIANESHAVQKIKANCILL